MAEYTLHVAGAVFLTTLAIAMARLGHRQGGVIWAQAWVFLYAGGVAGALTPQIPALSIALPLTGTAFATLLVAGTLLFTGRVIKTPRSIWLIGLSIASLRVAAQPLISPAASQVVGAVVICAGVLASCWILLFPIGRKSTGWERTLAAVFPLIGGVALLFAWSKVVAGSPVRPIILWQLVGNAVAFLQAAAYVARSTERVNTLRLEAECSRDAHARAEERYREITDRASDMITELDETGRILYANPAHEMILGYRADELVGKMLDTFVPLRGSMTRESVIAIGFARATHQCTVDIPHAHDGTRVLESNIQRFTGPSGGLRFVALSRDITARVASERLREAAREQLESLVEERTSALRESLLKLQKTERLASIGTLAAGIAHQINNPIGSIQLASEFALSAENEADEREVWHDAIVNSIEQAQRCGRIVSSILQFARNESTTKSEEDLVALLKRVCRDVEGYAEKRRATLEVEISAESLPVMGSAIALEQALLNIVRNAAESSVDPVRIEVAASRDDDLARITIADDGSGMDRDEVKHAFDPFFTTRLDRGGTGLGLSVAHGVISDHGGSISLESAEDVGTKITISMPLAKQGNSEPLMSPQESI